MVIEIGGSAYGSGIEEEADEGEEESSSEEESVREEMDLERSDGGGRGAGYCHGELKKA